MSQHSSARQHRLMENSKPTRETTNSRSSQYLSNFWITDRTCHRSMKNSKAKIVNCRSSATRGSPSNSGSMWGIKSAFRSSTWRWSRWVRNETTFCFRYSWCRTTLTFYKAWKSRMRTKSRWSRKISVPATRQNMGWYTSEKKSSSTWRSSSQRTRMLVSLPIGL